MSTVPLEKTDLVLGPECNGILMTPEEFDAITEYDECYVYELIRGVVIVSEFASNAEAGSNEELSYLLRNYRDSHPRGSALDATLPWRYIRTSDSRRIADRVIWAGLGRRPDPDVDVPAIAVDLISAGKRNLQRDYITKRREYLAVSVSEYWIIDRFQRTLTVWRADGTDLVVAEKKTYRTPLLPGFALPLARILAAADRWAASN